tara:strand:- start:345 stop:596 length:252 start_codon:yes stop_codon:yes gene_type:complete
MKEEEEENENNDTRRIQHEFSGCKTTYDENVEERIENSSLEDRTTSKKECYHVPQGTYRTPSIVYQLNSHFFKRVTPDIDPCW